MREHPHHIAKEAARRELQAWLYLSLTAVLILVTTAGFLWWTW